MKSSGPSSQRGVEHRRDGSPGQHGLQERLARAVSPEPGTHDERVRPVDRVAQRGLERGTERGFDGQHVGQAGAGRFDRRLGGDQAHESRPRREGRARGVERGAGHPVRAADHGHASAVALVHRRQELGQPRGGPGVGHEKRQCRVGVRQADIDHDDAAARVARHEMPAPRSAERDGQLRAHGTVRLAARQVESRGPVDRHDGGAVVGHALRVALDACETYERLGSPEGELALAEAALYLAIAPKSNAAYTAFGAAQDLVRGDASRPVPERLRNAPTRLMNELGHGRGYRYAHDETGAYAAGESYFPDGMRPPEFYRPTERGLEAKIREHLDRLRQLDAEARRKKRDS